MKKLSGSLSSTTVTLEQKLDYCDKGPKSGLCTTFYCISWPSYICFFFSSVLHTCLAVIVELRSTPWDLISIKQFVIWVSFTVHEKLSGKTFLKALINASFTHKLFYSRVSQWAFWESAVQKPCFPGGQMHTALSFPAGFQSFCKRNEEEIQSSLQCWGWASTPAQFCVDVTAQASVNMGVNRNSQSSCAKGALVPRAWACGLPCVLFTMDSFSCTKYPCI